MRRVDGLPYCVGEYERIAVYREPFLRLTFLVMQQGLRGLIRKDDVAAAVRGLWRLEGLTVAGDEGPLYMQHAKAKVQVGPKQASDLSEAHPGGQPQHV